MLQGLKSLSVAENIQTTELCPLAGKKSFHIPSIVPWTWDVLKCGVQGHFLFINNLIA